ncbi:hypothetical protein BST61_g4566 [Cercospora zeina]
MLDTRFALMPTVRRALRVARLACSRATDAATRIESVGDDRRVEGAPGSSPLGRSAISPRHGPRRDIPTRCALLRARPPGAATCIIAIVTGGGRACQWQSSC